MTWSLIAAGSALLLIGVAGRLVWFRQRFWLALTQAAINKELGRVVEPETSQAQTFQCSLHSLGSSVSLERGTTSTTTGRRESGRLTTPSRTRVG